MTSDAAINKHIKELEGEIDLSKLKKDYTVKFQCGGESVVVGIDIRDHIFYLLFPEISPDCGNSFPYDKNGIGKEWTSLLDIMEIIPAVFDWATVKPGMAFDDGDGLIKIFVAKSLLNQGRCVTCSLNHDSLKYSLKSALTRAPEHDIEVQG